MKSEDLQDAIGEIDDDILQDAKRPFRRLYTHKKIIFGAVAGLFAMVVIGNAIHTIPPTNKDSADETTKAAMDNMQQNGDGSSSYGGTIPEDSTQSKNQHGLGGLPLEGETSEGASSVDENAILNAPDGALVKAVYPTAVPYPTLTASQDSSAWNAERRIKRGLSAKYETALESFLSESIPTVLSNTNHENIVYSPLNLYMAMSMLAEITDGASRQQILDLLDIDDLNTLRTQTNAIWNANYSDDGAITSILANSLWINEDCSLPQDTLKTLGNYYYASVYQGKMGSTDFDTLYRNWLNQQTRNHLEDYIQNKTLDPAAVMSLVSTIFYQAKWEVPFPKENTKKGIFHGSWKDFNCEYMYDFYLGCHYYKNDLFSTVSIPMESGGHMWIFLPKEGVSAETLLEQSDIVKRLASESYFPTTYSKVHLTLPKFSISSQLNLKESLKLLGLTEIFDTSQNLYVSNVEHTAKVAIDEEGCIATAYTEMQLMGAGMTEDEITFTADRPFMFAITSIVDTPLFVGIVNQPS